MKKFLPALLALTLIAPAAYSIDGGHAVADIKGFSADVKQVHAVIGALDTLAVAPDRNDDGTPASNVAIVTLSGVLGQRLTKTQGDFNLVVNNPDLSSDDKVAFLQQAFLDITAVRAELSALIAVLQANYTDTSGNFTFAQQVSIFNQGNAAIAGSFNSAASLFFPNQGPTDFFFPNQGPTD